jgi:hypothetical protein
LEEKYDTDVSTSEPVSFNLDLHESLNADTLLKKGREIIFNNYFSKRSYKFSYFLTNKMFHSSLNFRRGMSKSVRKTKTYKPDEAHKIRYLIIPNVKYIKVTKKSSVQKATKVDLFRYFIFHKKDSSKNKKLNLVQVNKSTEYFDHTFFPEIKPNLTRSKIYNSKIYGFLEQHDTDEIQFKIVDNLNTNRQRQLTQGSKISSRDERKGNVCGTAGGTRGSKAGMIENFVKYTFKCLDVKMTAAQIKDYKSQSSKPSICFEIRAVLRFLEEKGYYFDDDGQKENLNKYYRFLYKKEIKDKIERTIMAFTL